MPNPDDPITPWVLKWIILPFVVTALILMVGELQINIWKCDREAKRQGYLEGTYVSPNRIGSGEACICRKKQREDGTIDPYAKLVIDLEDRKLPW